jgi:hypothetical protein
MLPVVILVDRIAALGSGYRTEPFSRCSAGTGSVTSIDIGLRERAAPPRTRRRLGRTPMPLCPGRACSFGLVFLKAIDHVRIGLIDTGYGVNSSRARVGSSASWCGISTMVKMSGFPQQGSICLISFISPRALTTSVGLAGMHVDQYVGSVRHASKSPVRWCEASTPATRIET